MNFKKRLFLLLILATYSLYSQKSKLPSEIKSIYFQHWMGGQEQAGGGTNFFVILKKPFSKTLYLKKVYFDKSEAVFEKRNDSLLIAYFRIIPNMNDQNNEGRPVMENKNPAKIDFKLNTNQAVLEFLKNNKIHRIWVSNVKEIKPLEYPSVQPQN